MKNRVLSFMLAICMLVLAMPFYSSVVCAEEQVIAIENETDLQLDATSVILMEYETGRVLYEKNADEQLPPASITKIMTLLLIMEALDAGKLSWDEPVIASERAASMGGSQIYLKVGEQMSVRDLVKSVVIASANDAAAALAEHVCGSIEAFVEKMNEKAALLGIECMEDFFKEIGMPLRLREFDIPEDCIDRLCELCTFGRTRKVPTFISLDYDKLKDIFKSCW